MLRLAAVGAGALGRVARDRAAESLGADVLPRTPAQLADAGVVASLLRDYAPGARSWPEIASAMRSGDFFESSNCTNFLIELEYASGAPEAPATLYAKMPCPELATRVFANTIDFWSIECRFCQVLAHEVPVRVPEVYAVAREGSRFVLLLENLLETPGVRMFVNREMAEGVSVERAKRCLSCFAELHAHFSGLAHDERELRLPERLHTWLSPSLRSMTRALNAAAIGPAHRRAPDLFSAALAETCREAISKWDGLVERWFAGPLTLVHGDSHLGNCFEYPAQDGDRVGLIDFQGVHWGQGVRDVQYFLANSLAPEVLAEAEGELLDHYLSQLAARGVPLAREVAWEQYRALSFQTLMVGVVSLGLGSLTETDDTVRRFLSRGGAAVQRLGFADWLSGL